MFLLSLVLSILVHLIISEHSDMTYDGSSTVLNRTHSFTVTVICLYRVFDDGGEYIFHKLVICLSSD